MSPTNPTDSPGLTASLSAESQDREARPPQTNRLARLRLWLRAPGILRTLAIWMLCEIAFFLVLGLVFRSPDALRTATLLLMSLGSLTVLWRRRTSAPRHG